MTQSRLNPRVWRLALCLTLGVYFTGCNSSDTSSPVNSATNQAIPQTQLDKLTQDLLNSGEGGTENSNEKASSAAKARRDSMLNSLKSNPEAVYRVGFSNEVRNSLPAKAQEYTESNQTNLQGTLEVRQELMLDGQETIHYVLHDDRGNAFPLFVVNSTGSLSESGQRLKIKHAFRIPAAEAAGSKDVLITDQADVTVIPEVEKAISTSIGQQSTLVILANFQDRPQDQPWTKDQINQTVFSTVNNFDSEASYRQTTLSGTVAGWYTVALNSTDTCNSITDNLPSLALAAASQAGINTASFKRQVFMFPNVGSCGWAGLGSIGMWGNASISWINGYNSAYVIAHELGHNFGLYHSNASRCSTSSPIGSSCSNIEYGDTADTMGGTFAHFNAFQKDRLGWLNFGTSPAITTVSTSGNYTIEPMATFSGNSKALKVLKANLANGSKDYYYVEFRQRVGVDTSLTSGNLTQGVLFHSGNSVNANSSSLLDMIPGTSTYSDAALVPGASFSDPNAPNGGVTFAVNSVSSAGANVSVTIGTGTPQCVRANPSLSIDPTQTQWVQPGQTTTYTLSVKNNDNSICASSSFALAATPPAGVSAALGSQAVTLAPGASTTVVLQATAGSGLGNGTYTIPVKATNTGVTSYTASVSANLGVQAACALANPTVTLSPGSQSGGAGSTLNYSISVKNNNSAACGAATFNLGQSVPSGFNGTFNASSLNLASGASGNATWNVTSPASATSGSYPLSVQASNSSSGGSVGSASATYVITPSSCATVAPTVVLSPSSNSIAAGGQITYTYAVRNNNPASCGTSTFNLVGTVPSGFTQSVSTTSVTLAPTAYATGAFYVRSPANAAAGSYGVSLKATNTTNSSNTATGSATYVVTQSPTKTVIRINAGAGSITDSDGTVWAADTGSSGATGTYSISTNLGANVSKVYNSSRYGDFNYRFSVPNGTYQVKMKFAEIYWRSSGMRLFNINLNGTSYRKNIDLYALAGFGRPYDITTHVTVTDGQITIKLNRVKDQATINAIELIQQ